MAESVGSPLWFTDYMPHGMCYGWEPSILWTSIAADLLIAASYFSIPFAIIWFLRRRPHDGYHHLYVLFAAFIFLCGVTHVFGIVTIFNGWYGYQAMIKLATALVSFLTAIAVFYYLPLALKIPTPEQLKRALEHSAQSDVFRSLSDSSPIGLMVVDRQFKIKLANKKLCAMFGYSESELLNASVNLLVDDAIKDMHSNFMKGYIDSPTDRYPMNMGRLVHGLTKAGERLPIEISLSVGDFNSQPHVFASIVDVSEKKHVNEQLHLALSRLERITAATDDGLWEWNIVRGEVWQSKQHLKMIGAKEGDDPSFDLWREHIHPDHTDIVIQKLWSAIDERKDLVIEYLGRTPSGRYEWFRSRGKVTYSDQGQALLMAGSLENIQEIKINEIELVNKTNYLEKVLNRSINGLYIYSFVTQGNIYINDEYSRITGYTIEDLDLIQEKGEFLSLFHPDEIDMVTDHINQVVNEKDGHVVPLQYRFRHKDGHWIWCMSHDSIFSLNEDDQPKEMLGTFIDITAIKESELIQNKLRQEFQNTFEQAAVGVAHVSLEGDWLKVNKKVCDILGYERDELIETNFQAITYPEDLNVDLKNVARLISGEDDFYAMEKRYICKDGQVIWARLTVSIVRDEKGEPDYFISVIEDIQNRKEIEEERLRLNQDLKVSNEQLTRFAYSASHDMQEPLRKISAFSTSLLERLGDKELDEKSRFELDRIAVAATRMKTMIQKLLELSRASHKELNISNVRLSHLLDESKEQLSIVLNDSGALVSYEHDIELYCDETVMLTVLQNLIKNSIKYAHPDRQPVIKVSAKQDKEHITLVVEDNGIGFSERYREAIFEPFKRLVNHQKIDGVGMGLAICRQLIRQHGGEMCAFGEEGKGARFEIKLPVNNEDDDH